MTRTPEVEHVLRIVRQVVKQHFPGDDNWILRGAPLMKAIETAVDEAGPPKP